MRAKTVFFLLLFIVNTSILSAQYSDYEQDYDNPNGFGHWDLGLNFGMHWANKYHAGFYDGSFDNVNTINFILDNPYQRQDIMRELNVADTFYLAELPQNMRYTPAFQIGIYFRKTFDNYTGISLQFDYTKLTAADAFTLEIDPQPLIGKEPDIRIYQIWGVEERINIDILYSKFFKLNNPMFIPFFESGININSTVVKDNKIQIENLQYSLINNYISGGYVPGTQPYTYHVQQGGIGWGISGAVGMKFVFNESVSIDPGFRIYYQKIKLEGYEEFKPSYSIFVRLSLSDFFAGGDDEY
ncbi:MAG: hypothetical protein DSY76_04490 [Bacteroidetes bacterium]|nr:MAG: hypothetical protein DSY76_04490 [Bacteroidota bacterium]